MEDEAAPTHLLLSSHRTGPFISATSHELLQLGQRPVLAAGGPCATSIALSQGAQGLQACFVCSGVVAEDLGLRAGSDDDFEEEFAGSGMQARSTAARQVLQCCFQSLPSSPQCGTQRVAYLVKACAVCCRPRGTSTSIICEVPPPLLPIHPLVAKRALRQAACVALYSFSWALENCCCF